MTFLAYLSASTDHNAQRLREDLSGLADGANDLAAVVAYLRGTLGDSEAVLAVDEARYQFALWVLLEELSRKSSPDLLT